MRDYRISAVVHRPSPALLEKFSRKQLPEETMMNTVGQMLLPLTFASLGQPVATAKLPSILDNELARLVLLSTEYGHKGAYAYIVAGPSGERLVPYRSQPFPEQYDHHGRAQFAAQQLGRVIWQKLPKGGCQIYIDQASVELSGREAVVMRKTVFSEFMRLGASPPSLTGELACWQPAVHALFERLACSQQLCASHYYAVRQ